MNFFPMVSETSFYVLFFGTPYYDFILMFLLLLQQNTIMVQLPRSGLQLSWSADCLAPLLTIICSRISMLYVLYDVILVTSIL